MDLVNLTKRLTNKYPAKEKESIEELTFVASGILVSLRRVKNLDDLEDTLEHQSWMYRACKELVEREGHSGVTSYQENGYSFSYAREHLSESLVGEITPYVRFF